MFLEQKGKELLEKNLFRNYCVHLQALFNYGLISPRSIYSNLKKILVSFFVARKMICEFNFLPRQKLQSEQSEVARKLEQARLAQVKLWVDKNPQSPAKKPETPLKVKAARSDTKNTAKALPKVDDAAATAKKGVKRKSSVIA